MSDEEGFYLKDFKEVSEHIRIIRSLIRDLANDVNNMKIKIERMGEK